MAMLSAGNVIPASSDIIKFYQTSWGTSLTVQGLQGLLLLNYDTIGSVWTPNNNELWINYCRGSGTSNYVSGHITNGASGSTSFGVATVKYTNPASHIFTINWSSNATMTAIMFQAPTTLSSGTVITPSGIPRRYYVSSGKTLDIQGLHGYVMINDEAFLIWTPNASGGPNIFTNRAGPRSSVSGNSTQKTTFTMSVGSVTAEQIDTSNRTVRITTPSNATISAVMCG